MALSANGNFVTQEILPIRTKTMVVNSAAVLYNTALCSLDTTEGEVKPFDGTQTDRLVGWHFGDSVTGNAAGTVFGTICAGGFIVRDLTVAALLNTTADYGADVYATDDATYTVTDPGSGVVVGRIVAEDGNRASGTAHVLMHDLNQR